MAKPELIAPQPEITPLSSADSRKKKREIPDDLLREASHRLAVISLLGAVLWVVSPLISHLQLGSDTSSGLRLMPYDSSDNLVVLGALTSFALFLYARSTKREPQFVLNLGIAYMVLTALELGLLSHWYVPPSIHPSDLPPVISWIGVVILMFAAVIPASPKKTVIAGLIAASMNPIGMLVAKARGVADFGPPARALLMHYPDFLLVGVAVVVARVVTRLGQQVSKAREMGSYQLGNLLKRGGMGEIYTATHRMLARPAAIKLIRAEMLTDGGAEDAQIAVKRFHREATAAANLRSPHTVELFDFGVTEDQTLYFVMELLDGMDLETMVKKHGPLPPARVIHILRQACESLEEAHERGLVHRDIKPANIHVGHVGIHDDFVKVLDFGLVKSVAKSTDVSLGTAVGRTPGTPAYMAPEMALGETVDGRADIYALGCVAYFLLTEKLVFDAENTFQMVAKHLNHQPVSPSERSGTQIPAKLEQLVLSCLSKNPADRPASAAALAQSLACINIEPWTDVQAREWWSRAKPVN